MVNEQIIEELMESAQLVKMVTTEIYRLLRKSNCVIVSKSVNTLDTIIITSDIDPLSHWVLDFNHQYQDPTKTIAI